MWDGRVTEVDGDIFTAAVVRHDGTGPELIADFSMAQCGVTVQPGDMIIVTPGSVTKRDLGVWTKADIDAIMARARKRSAMMRRNAMVD